MDAAEHLQRRVAYPLAGPVAIGKHDDAGAGHLREIVRAFETHDEALDGTALPDLKCLARGQRTPLAHDHAPRDEIEPGYRPRARAAEIPRPHYRDRLHRLRYCIRRLPATPAMSMLQGKVAIVTGGSRGIGLAIADAL